MLPSGEEPKEAPPFPSPAAASHGVEEKTPAGTENSGIRGNPATAASATGKRALENDENDEEARREKLAFDRAKAGEGDRDEPSPETEEAFPSSRAGLRGGVLGAPPVLEPRVDSGERSCSPRHKHREGGTGGSRSGVVEYSFVACISHLTIDHTSVSGRSTVPTINRDTAKHLGAQYVISPNYMGGKNAWERLGEAVCVKS